MSGEGGVTVFVCGGDVCPEGGQHDDKGHEVLYGPGGKACGESVACSKCGSTAFERDMLRLP